MMELAFRGERAGFGAGVRWLVGGFLLMGLCLGMPQVHAKRVALVVCRDVRFFWIRPQAGRGIFGG